MHSQDWVSTALHQCHTDGVTMMEYKFLLLFAPVGFIQKSRTLKSIEFSPPFETVYFFSFKNPYSSVYLQECIAAVLKAHTSLLLTNWACLAVVSLLTAGQITHMHTLSLAPSLFLTHTRTHTQTLLLICTVHKHVSASKKEKVVTSWGECWGRAGHMWGQREEWNKKPQHSADETVKHIWSSNITDSVNSCLNLIITQLADKILTGESTHPEFTIWDYMSSPKDLTNTTDFFYRILWGAKVKQYFNC